MGKTYIKSKISQRYNCQLARNPMARRGLNLRMKAICPPKVSPENLQRIKNYWGGYKINSDYFAMYNAMVSNGADFDVRFVPDDIYYCYVDPYYHSLSESKTLSDKNYYDLMFSDVSQARTIGRKISGVLLDEKYEPTTSEKLLEAIKLCGGAILKVSIGSLGGYGCYLWREGDDIKELEDYIGKVPNLVIQELIHQHPSLSKLHPESVNTIRMISFIRNGKVKVLSTIIRMGVGKNNVDNVSSGGIFCGVDENGCLRKYAWEVDGHRYESHPTTGVIFDGYPIPGIDKAKDLINKLAWRLSRTNRVVSWDFTIDENGEPLFIEANLNMGGLAIHQIANGPLFGDETREIIDEVFRSKAKRLIQKLF